MPFISKPLPDFSPRKGTVSVLVIHKVVEGETYHISIDRDGTMYEHGDFDDRAPHCGISTLHCNDDVDDMSIGIGLVGSTGTGDYTDDQIGTLITLCSALCFEYKISLNCIVGHSHVSPNHEEDPGRDFAWFEFLNVVGARVVELSAGV